MAVSLSKLIRTRQTISDLADKLKAEDFLVEDYHELKLLSQIMVLKLYTAENYLNSIIMEAHRIQNSRAAQPAQAKSQKGDNNEKKQQ